jgi:hypothetical protein
MIPNEGIQNSSLQTDDTFNLGRARAAGKSRFVVSFVEFVEIRLRWT